MFWCFRNCLDTFAGTENHIPLQEIPAVTLDTSYMGYEVVIVKNGARICGTGGALGSAPIVQNKAYFEVKLQQSGHWGVGLATRQTNLNRVPLGQDPDAWVLCSDGIIRHNNQEKWKVSELPQEGDIMGISYDHVELNFYINGESINCPVTGIKGCVFPVLYVDDGAILDAKFDHFLHPPPQGFDKIMLEQSLL